MKLYVCDGCFVVSTMAVVEMGMDAFIELIEDALGIPRGGLDRVIILRAQSPESAGFGRRPWAQLSFCYLCGAGAGADAPRG